MRKVIIYFWLSILFLGAFTPSFTQHTYGKNILYGDLNGDNKVDSSDYVLLRRYILNIISVFPASNDITIADLDGNLMVDSTDYILLRRFLLGIIDIFPVQTNLPDDQVPGTPEIRYIGRFDFSDYAGPKFAWSASTITANFEGTEAKATIKSHGDNWFAIIVDNVVMPAVNINNTTKTITLASGLNYGKHTVTIFKRTEAQVGVAQLLGFDFGAGKLLAPPPRDSRKIEFIGDSITCAYGNEGTDKSQPFTPKNQNSYLSYSSITARALNAEQISVAYSGKGVISNYGGNTHQMMPELYARIIPQETKIWDYTSWTPDVVVINLGTNDYSTSIPNSTAFTNGYKSLVEKVRLQYPNSHIICSVGPMLWGEGLDLCRSCIRNVVKSFNESGDIKVHFLEYPQQKEQDGYGEDWHPSLKTHQKMADLLTATIKDKLGW